MGVSFNGKQSNITISQGGNDAEVNANGQLKVVLDGKVDTSNTSSTPLAIDGVYTGTGVSTLDYAMIFVNIYSDVASAVDGLSIQTSSDNVTWRSAWTFTVPAGIEQRLSFPTNKLYYRVKYTNGETAQTTFDLQTVLKKNYSKPSSHRIKDAITEEHDATLQKSVITGEDSDGTFVNIEAGALNDLKVIDSNSRYMLEELFTQQEILKELKKMNLHLQCITNERF